MSTVTTKDGVQIFYKDWGHGQPIVFHHGWPLSSDDWDTQMLFFVLHGYRVIGIDRRGHGRSSQVSLHIDIPVKLTDVKFVSSIGSLAFEGDLRRPMSMRRVVSSSYAIGGRIVLPNTGAAASGPADRSSLPLGSRDCALTPVGRWAPASVRRWRA